MLINKLIIMQGICIDRNSKPIMIIGLLINFISMTIFFDIYQNKINLPPNEKVFWRISAYAIVTNKEKILLLKPQYDTSKWILPGGGIEPNESIKKGIERECYEETGYKIKVDTSHPIYLGESNFYDLEGSGKFLHSINLVYPGKLVSEKQDKHVINTIELNEVDEVDWIKLKAINEKNCHHIMYPAIEAIKKDQS
jgi:ADP-ribose pyrophosphatase YjhB (NUDIX family)